jgi:hypothetical protein
MHVLETFVPRLQQAAGHTQTTAAALMWQHMHPFAWNQGQGPMGVCSAPPCAPPNLMASAASLAPAGPGTPDTASRASFLACKHRQHGNG